MPIYEYQCKNCGHQLEALQRLSEDPLKDCPACGESQLSRLISAAGFRLKGSGWYETDFKKDKKRNVADDKGDKSADNKTAKSADGDGKAKSESKEKPAKSADSKPKDAAAR